MQGLQIINPNSNPVRLLLKTLGSSLAPSWQSVASLSWQYSFYQLSNVLLALFEEKAVLCEPWSMDYVASDKLSNLIQINSATFPDARIFFFGSYQLETKLYLPIR